MNTYELRTAIRDNTNEEMLPDELRKEIEAKLYELDRLEQLRHNYRAVLADILK